MKSENIILNELLSQPEIFESEIVPRICQFDMPSAINLSSSSRALHGLFKQALDKKAATHLLQLIIYGEKDQAEEMIKRYPNLLTVTATAIDYAGHKICGTPLQVAMVIEDISVSDHHEEMVEMIERYLKDLPNGNNELIEQILEQFPDQWEEKEKEKYYLYLTALQKIFKVIGNSTTNQQCEAALNEFKKDLNSTATVRYGKMFPSHLLIDFFIMYHDNFESFGGRRSRKNNLVWTRVGGEIQFHLPSNFAQAIINGIYHLIEKDMPIFRNLFINLDETAFYYRRDAINHIGLGCNAGIFSCISSPGTCVIKDTFNVVDGFIESVTKLKNYVQRKQDRLARKINEAKEMTKVYSDPTINMIYHF